MTNISNILDTVSSVLSTLRQISNIPGVNMLPYVSTASSAISALKTAVDIGKDVEPYLTAIAGTFGSEGVTPTQEQLDSLDAKILELGKELNAPLPDKEDGEQD